MRDAAVEGGYHKWAWGGEDDLPPWFEQDESRHCRVTLPITREDAQAEKAALRAIDARPAKKVAEARARKKKRLHARLEAAKSAANAIADQEDVPLASRMRQIERVYAKSNRMGGKAGARAAKSDKKSATRGATGGGGKKLDARMRKDKREVGSKRKKEAAKKTRIKNKSKAKGR
jgi:AdoMet-dependent rRNA methyltransferase SPB1